jgi:S-adenosylmethionine synthetase
MRSNYLFTSESVSEGHPDKVADQISDAVVDLMLGKDPEARIACETMVTTQRVLLAGEVRCKGVFDLDAFPDTEGWAPGSRDEIEQVVRRTIQRIGYEQEGFHWQTAYFANHLHGQSAHIAQGVDASGNKDEGAGDQGIMFGYATDETPDLLPATLYYSHRILQRLAEDRHAGTVDFLEPDAKSQVTLQYENGAPVRAAALVVSTQHSKELSNDAGQARLRDYVKGVFSDVLPQGWMPGEESIFVNPTGLFEIGGPTVTPGSPAARSSSTPMAARLPTAAGLFPARIPPRWIARPLM